MEKPEPKKILNYIYKHGWQLLEHPNVYRGFRIIFGSEKFRKYYASVIDAKQGDRIMDIGCGTGDILNYLPDVQYLGFDMNEKYIVTAKRLFRERGKFICAALQQYNSNKQTSFDIVLANGVLHHLDNDACSALFRLAYESLSPGGRLITLDGVYTPNQNLLQRFFVSRDRGRFIRQEEEYAALARACFRNVRSTILSGQIRLPYTHLILECTK
jgi:2-polyprenyl-3-methyl-5-hydroxy-6-metoxy-1,4-benzoquinol methylase